MDAVISLERYKIEKLLYSRILDEHKDKQDDLQIELNVYLTEDKKKGKVAISAEYTDVDSIKMVSATINGYFEINVEADGENYLATNGVAILFPYLRSAISMISTLDSDDAIVIPTYNVLNLLDNYEETQSPN